MTCINQPKLIMKSTLYFLVLLLLVAAMTAQGKCRKTVWWGNDNLLQVNSEDNVRMRRHTKLLQLAVSNLDCQVIFLKMPWGRALKELQHGRLDMMGSAYKTAERQQFAWYSDFAFDASSVLFMRTADIGKYPLTRLEDILKYRLKIGTEINVIYNDEFSLLLKNDHFASLMHPNISRNALWRMLQIGRIDGFISELTPGLNELKNLGLLDKISPSELVVSTQATHVIFSKKTNSPDFVDKIDRELLELSKTNFMEQE